MKFKFDLKKHLATLSDDGRLSVELNIIQFSGYAAKYDLRRWRYYPDGGKRMQKGLTMTAAELRKLRDTLNALEI